MRKKASLYKYLCKLFFFHFQEFNQRYCYSPQWTWRRASEKEREREREHFRPVWITIESSDFKKWRSITWTLKRKVTPEAKNAEIYTYCISPVWWQIWVWMINSIWWWWWAGAIDMTFETKLSLQMDWHISEEIIPLDISIQRVHPHWSLNRPFLRHPPLPPTHHGRKW